MFIMVTSKGRDQQEREHLINVSHIVSINQNDGRAIIRVEGSDHNIWTREDFQDVIDLVAKAGGDIKELDE